ncbi:hypothetical protein [Cellulosimicrobium sp. SH8]|uniref:hypothetical protein n=1 Tax=Cellulosimicrobium sp. SH8 TaxID=2952936 RepID=UPI0021F27F1F|nr:hypothetical protein [Cellulosimicrobium sp. SH8]
MARRAALKGTADLTHSARVTVAEHSTSLDDARELLAMLGIDTEPPAAPTAVDQTIVERTEARPRLTARRLA